MRELGEREREKERQVRKKLGLGWADLSRDVSCRVHSVWCRVAPVVRWDARAPLQPAGGNLRGDKLRPHSCRVFSLYISLHSCTYLLSWTLGKLQPLLDPTKELTETHGITGYHKREDWLCIKALPSSWLRYELSDLLLGASRARCDNTRRAYRVPVPSATFRIQDQACCLDRHSTFPNGT